LFGILSVCTICCGLLTGTYFAIRLPDGHPLRVLPSVHYLAEARNVQRLCFLVGVVHLTIAHLWNAAVTRPWLKAVGRLAWVPILWANYLLAKVMVLGDPQQPAMLWLYVTGLLGVLLFTEPSLNPVRMVGHGLGKMALNLTNSFVDVVSYVRLFAAGAAGIKVAESLNEMAFGLKGAVPWLGPLLALLLLVLGHAFNMALGTMAVLVHGVRLNVMEFAGHIGIEFSGQAYRPLRRRPTPER
jgi:V/A-type H+-transporting ATPase subunit I